MEKRNINFTHSYSNINKRSIIRYETDNQNINSLINRNRASSLHSTVISDDTFFKLVMLSIKKNARSCADNQIIAKYIQGLEEFSNMIKRCMDNYLDLINIISQTIKYEFHESNKILFRTGEKGEKFYVILEGSVDIIVAKDIKMDMTEDEFMSYLEKLYFYEEFFLLNNCLNSNRKTLKYEFKQGRGVKAVFKRSRTTRAFNISDFGMFFKEKNIDNIYKTDYNDYIERLKPIHNTDKLTKETKLMEFNVWQYYHVLKLNSGQYFGETALLSADLRR